MRLARPARTLKLVRLLAVALFALGGTGPAPLRADEMPSVEELVARNQTASGLERRPSSEIEEWRVTIADLEGTVRIVHHERDTVTTTMLGPFTYARGVAGGQAWHQNENGETVLEKPQPSQTERVLARSVERVHEPLDAYVVRSEFASGHVTRTFYDPVSYLVVRYERLASGHTAVTTYDDFRTDGRGRTRAWHYTGGDERNASSYDYRLVRDEAAPAAETAALTVPPDRRTLVEFPAGRTSVRLPARIVRGRIYVRLDIGGRGLDFLFDSGASQMTISPSIVRELGLTVYGRQAQTVAGNFETGRVIVPQIGIGPLVMHDAVMRTAPFDEREASDTRVVGLLGFDFIDGAAIRIDYEEGTVDAIARGAFVPDPDATAVDVRLNGQVPVGTATLGDAPANDVILDTGGEGAFIVFQRFARVHAAQVGKPTGRPGLAAGVGGTFRTAPVTLAHLALGGWDLSDVSGLLVLGATAFGHDDDDALLGAGVLSLFTVTFDYADSRVYLKPNARFPAAGPSTARAGS